MRDEEKLTKEINRYESAFSALYGGNEQAIEQQSTRYQHLLSLYWEKFNPDEEIHFFSTPGRIEIGGNHTDHNHGLVLAAAVNLDAVAVAAKKNGNIITLFSEGFSDRFVINISDLKPMFEELGTTSALIRGVAARLDELEYSIGGFNACIKSDVLPGSGLSSSAAFEVLISQIFNTFFNNGRIEGKELAKISQYAENHYFGKPCGLMDQTTCAVGGIVSIDFENPENPDIKSIQNDFSNHNYKMIVVNTGGSHANLTDEYAAIPDEMISVAKYLNTDYCRNISIKDLLSRINDLRINTGDRAILRALHFIGENERVKEQVRSLENEDFARFLDLINESGNSSFKWLQNCYSTKNVSEQGISLALALSENYINEVGQGACRVHGGGFAGTILAFLHVDHISGYINLMESVFGKQSAMVLDIRNQGTVYLNALI
jgi:galactokinase